MSVESVISQLTSLSDKQVERVLGPTPRFAVWCVMDCKGKEVARFPWKERAAAEAKLAELGGSHWLTMKKV